MPVFNQIALAAPDIVRTCLRTWQPQSLERRTTLYASGPDRAMLASCAAADGNVRAGDVTEEGAAIAEGVDTIDVTQITDDPLALYVIAHARPHSQTSRKRYAGRPRADHRARRHQRPLS